MFKTAPSFMPSGVATYRPVDLPVAYVLELFQRLSQIVYRSCHVDHPILSVPGRKGVERYQRVVILRL